ncbi:hypothetical protein ACLB2K_056073 [Fragaria x ananassa]
MSSTNAKALNSMKQKLKKNNKEYEDLIQKYKENPVEEEFLEEEEVETNCEAEVPKHEENQDKREKEDGWERKSGKKSKLVLDKQQFMSDPCQVTWETVNKKYKEVAAVRGRKGTRWFELVEQLIFLAKFAKTPAQKLEILLSIVSAQFDAGLHGHMPAHVWKKSVHNMLVILDILVQYPSIRVDDKVEIDDNESQKGADYKGTIWVNGNLAGFVERLDNEFFKSLQSLDPHTTEYIDRLRDEPMLFLLAQNFQEYLEQVGDYKAAAKLALRQVELLHYKPHDVYDAMRKLAEQRESADNGEAQAATSVFLETPELVRRRPAFVESNRAMMDILVSLIYKYGDDRTKARAMLCDIFHHALNNDFYTSRDLLLKSHLQDNIHQMDNSSKILFNRAMAQLGLCAFRSGLITEGHSYLSDLYLGGKVKELLGQGVSRSRYQEMTPEQESLQRPYHMHINLELLEAVHLICAMLQEVPNMAAVNTNKKRRVISRAFRWLLENQTFIGPPETVRDHVIAATMALLKEAKARSIVSQMIMNEELHARLDQPTGCIVFHDIEHTRLQALAFQFSEKLSFLAESNERATELRIGGGGLELSTRHRDSQDYGAGSTSMSGRWQENLSFTQGRQGGTTRRTGYRSLTYGHTGYQDAAHGGSRRIGYQSASSGRGSQMDTSTRLVSLNRVFVLKGTL